MNEKTINNRVELKDKFISKERVRNICNKLRNTQDKLLVYIAYMGICDGKMDNIRHLKYTDYCPVEEEIRVGEKKYNVDWYLNTLLEECKKENIYYVQNGKVAYGAKDKFEVNLESEYILRGKPSALNKNGLEPISYASLQKRMVNIAEIVGENIAYNKLNRSKVVEEMCLIKKKWKNREVEEYLKENEYRFKTSTIAPLIKVVTNEMELTENENKDLYKDIESIETNKLTVYEKDSIQGLYKVVAGMSMVNEIQKRKLENEHYKINEYNYERDMELRAAINELIEIDRLYWEFIVNEGFKTQEEYLIKIYAGKEEYLNRNEKYYISYINGVYNVFYNIEYVGKGELDALQNSLYSSSDCVNIVGWIVDDFNQTNVDERRRVLNKIPYCEAEKVRFTAPYINDMGLDMILMLKSVIEFKVLNRAYNVCEKLESVEGVLKTTPCVDVSTDGETFILISMNNGDHVHIQIGETYQEGIKYFDSMGTSGRFKVFEDAEGLKEYLEALVSEGCVMYNKYYTGGHIGYLGKSCVDKLAKAIDIANEESVVINDEFVRSKSQEYLNYTLGKEQIVIDMYDCDLVVIYDGLEKAYLIKKYVKLKGSEYRIYDVWKSRDIEEIVNWLKAKKVSTFNAVDYSVF